MFLSYLDTLVDICVRSHRREAERVIWSGLRSPRCLTIFFSTFIFDKEQTLKYIHRTMHVQQSHKRKAQYFTKNCNKVL
jgi:hypothetical protein